MSVACRKEQAECFNSSSATLLCCTCTVHLRHIPGHKYTKKAIKTVSGTLFEVRALWQPRIFTTPLTGACTTLPEAMNYPLYGFVRIKDVDHRFSGWFPLCFIELKEPLQLLPSLRPVLGGGSVAPAELQSGILASDAISQPILSGVYTQITVGMARTQRAKKQLDYLEERLLRDGMTPTTIRNFVYLNRYVFAAWYYAPYGLFHPEFSPVVPLLVRHGGLPQLRDNHESEIFDEGKRSLDGVADQPKQAVEEGVLRPNPFIKDAYLCPFSLRVYTTYGQLFYETQTYRQGRLRPPGVEIYRDDLRGFSLFEINGSHHITYCRHIFLLGKSFLENKLAGHDVHSYFFYVFVLHHRHFPRYVDDTSAMYFAGYFTWEKQVAECNLACIVTLPCFASGSDGFRAENEGGLKGIGQFMIAASYELAYRRRQVGSPEKPLSDLGAAAYRRFWRRHLLQWLLRQASKLASHCGGPPSHLMHVKGGMLPKAVGDSGRKRARSAAAISPTAETPKPARLFEGKEVVCHTISSRSSSSLCLGESDEEVTDDAGTENAVHNDSIVVTIKDIAQEIRLEEADVLKTVLGLGLLHRNAEERSYRMVVPRAFVEWELARVAQMERSLQHAVFNSVLLLSKSASYGGGRSV